MPTTDELQAQINALQSQLNSILGMADDDYIHQYSGEEIDAGITAAGGAVRYDLAQSLTAAQQKQARENIGADAVQGAVRYDQAQSLTAAQQAQARGNIAAAPDGYGLGNFKLLSASDDIDTIYAQSGFYHWESSIPANAPFAYTNMVVFGYTQILAQPITGTIMTRTYGSGKWLPLEYINPPLARGVEYRTTERYLGKPVYCKLVNFGKLPNNAIKEVAHDISNLQYAVSVSGESNGDNLIGNMYITYVNVGGATIRIKTNADRSNVNAAVLIKYTKTTD